ncbi:hypothetical protein [Pseudoalteromonas rubra]|uniref:hypothetical protein n=1 Tax=Pseudoalteromonas rubra TaxID=43658 RepID=UPI000F7B7C2E|nr:hypothetical protein [Pseudoalteromonas rubra]
MKTFTVLLLILLSFNTYAGFRYSNSSAAGSVVVPVKLADEGLYNLVIGVEFMTRPYNKKPYDTDSYEELIDRIRIQWREPAIQTVLENTNIKLTELAGVKKAMVAKLDALIEKTKLNYGISKNTEVVYSVSHFYLSKPE